MFSARDSGMLCAIRCCASQFQTPTSQATYKNRKRASRKSTGLPKTGPTSEKSKLRAPLGGGIGVRMLIASVTAVSAATV